ncbi:hypothetical protein BKA60DRAFT_683169 [Fusarium oxysporum]|nr:hypothetical protein BKA60DRAFT_683169 [Fusarium oxysporum]
MSVMAASKISSGYAHSLVGILSFLISSSSVMNLWMAGVVGMRNLVGRWGWGNALKNSSYFLLGEHLAAWVLSLPWMSGLRVYHIFLDFFFDAGCDVLISDVLVGSAWPGPVFGRVGYRPGVTGGIELKLDTRW